MPKKSKTPRSGKPPASFKVGAVGRARGPRTSKGVSARKSKDPRIEALEKY